MTTATQAHLRYPQYKQPDYPAFEDEIQKFWDDNRIFKRSVEQRPVDRSFVFYEGPPSANGMPGIHHVMARAIKDLFCRYRSLKGYRVERRAGWDTHGLPIELQVEKRLGITKKDIGERITIADYNRECRQDVMQFKDKWDDLTRRMGFWLDLDRPYITYENNYIESVWSLLRQLYDRNLLYKGYTIQPYSPAAGTGLSSHELNQPGCYRPVKDTSCVAQFERVDTPGEYFLAWTTTPWTLPANSALAVGEKITYALVQTRNPYTGLSVRVWLAKNLLGKYFSPDGQTADLDAYKPGDKVLPYRLLDEKKGAQLAGIRYHQLLPYVQPVDENGNDLSDKAFRVIVGDFVSTEDGTGIVHIAPTFGADDKRTADQNGVPAILVPGPDGELVPIVDRQGKYVPQMGEFAGRFVKQEYSPETETRALDIDISIKLKEANRAFRVEKYEHNYPHCWRTDKPVLYYPLDSWFIRTSALRDRMVEANRQIRWKPESTGTGRFANWLENLTDWNLSRSRYWGIPLPIWANEDRTELRCIGSVQELGQAIDDAIAAGIPQRNITRDEGFDLHRPFIDQVILADSQGRPMYREPDLIDVWFDSGAMPYAQWHYPFENQDEFRRAFPADFIAEGVDQTRGWFFTLHAIAVMLFDQPAYKTVVSNGLVLDKNGQKMSKRLGNAVDPFHTIDTYGADPTRWYMVENAPPWENLRFNIDNLVETQRKFFGTLFNTYNFFALYANIDGYEYQADKAVPVAQRPEMDRWIVSQLQSLIQQADAAYDDYEPTRAARAVQNFVVEELSNWYVRLSRRRFWKDALGQDKHAAFDTLHECLSTVAQLMSPIAPFFADWLYRNLNPGGPHASVHLTDWPAVQADALDPSLAERMAYAQTVSSLAHRLRKAAKIKQRIPLQKILVPVDSPEQKAQLERVERYFLDEINVKEAVYVADDSTLLVKKLKLNFKALGPRVGAKIKALQAAAAALDTQAISQLERNGSLELSLEGEPFTLVVADVEVLTEDLPGWAVAREGRITVALDLTVTDDLRDEGLARDVVNRLQNLRKDTGFEVADRIHVQIAIPQDWQRAISAHQAYICDEILADTFSIDLATQGAEIEIDGLTAQVALTKA